MTIDRDIAISLLEEIIEVLNPPKKLELEKSWLSPDLSVELKAVAIGFRRPKGWVRVIVIVDYISGQISISAMSMDIAAKLSPDERPGTITYMADPEVVKKTCEAITKLIRRHLSYHG